MTEILHLNYNPGPAGWILRLQAQLQQSASATLRARYSRWKESGMAELGMAFASRLALRHRAGFLLSKLLNDLRDQINGSGKLDELLDGGYAYYPEKVSTIRYRRYANGSMNRLLILRKVNKLNNFAGVNQLLLRTLVSRAVE